MFQMRANIVAMGVIGAALLLPELAQAEQTGHASWYALHSRTASGEMMNPSAMTAAHRSLPFGTKVVVENLNNGKAVVVRINDRGPFIKGRIIDVSKAAASVLGMLGSGTARVKVSTSGGSSLKVAAKEESPVKVATATTKMETASGDKFAKVEDAPVKSAKMEGVSASKPVKVAAKASKPAKVASASRGKSTKTAKASSKAAKIVTASAAKRSGKSETRVAGLMKSSRDIKRVASRAASRKTYAVVSRSGSRKAVAVASRELGKSRRGQAKGAVVLASSANPYGAFVRSASFIN
jgi:rare lipoprotein A